MDDGNGRNKTVAAAAIGAIVAVASTAIYAIVTVVSIFTGGDKSKEKSKECKCFTNKL